MNNANASVTNSPTGLGQQGTYSVIMNVGNSQTITAGTNAHVVGVGIFNDGSKLVLVDTYI